MPIKPSSAPLKLSLQSLVSGGVLSQSQAEYLASLWPELDRDTFAHPYLHSVREHTRAYLEAIALSVRRPSPPTRPEPPRPAPVPHASQKGDSHV